MLKLRTAATLAFTLLSTSAYGDDADPEDVQFLVTFMAIEASIAVTSVAFVGIDAYYGAKRSWLPKTGAVLELILGALPNIGMGLVFLAPGCTAEVCFWLATSHLAVGSALLAHSLLSIRLYQRHAIGDNAEGREVAFPVVIGAMPTQGGALGTLVYEF